MLVTVENKESIALVTLCDALHLNVLSKQLIKELNDILSFLEQDDSVKMILLKADGKVFSAGANLKEIIEYKKNAEVIDFIEDWQCLSKFSKPVIAALEKSVFGGGLELVLQADILIAASSVEFSLPELSVGVIPGGGATQRLTQRLGKGWTSYLCMAGYKLSAREAFDLGLIQKIVDDENCVLDEALSIASKIAKIPLTLLREVKKSISFAAESPLKKGIEQERESFYKTLTFKEHDDMIQSFFKKR
ncbi:MAG: putative enoyl-CoA hydratase echA8 [Holosporales bacterium]